VLRSLIGQQKETTAINEDSETNRLGKVASTDKARIQGRLSELLRRSVDKTLNARLVAEADAVCGVRCYVRSPDGINPPTGHYDRMFYRKNREIRPSTHLIAGSREKKPILCRLFKLNLRLAALHVSLPPLHVQLRSAQPDPRSGGQGQTHPRIGKSRGCLRESE
jgi:hypothetical protein